MRQQESVLLLEGRQHTSQLANSCCALLYNDKQITTSPIQNSASDWYREARGELRINDEQPCLLLKSSTAGYFVN